MRAPQRSVLALKDVEGPSFAEFSHIVGSSEPNVRAPLQQGPPAPVVGHRRLSERTLRVGAAAAIGEPDGRGDSIGSSKSSRSPVPEVPDH